MEVLFPLQDNFLLKQIENMCSLLVQMKYWSVMLIKKCRRKENQKMKKKIAGVLLLCAVMAGAGCGKSGVNTEIFQPLVKQWESSNKSEFPKMEENTGLQNGGQKETESLSDMSYLVEMENTAEECIFTKIQLDNGKSVDDLKISLKEYGGNQNWMLDNVFYMEETNNVYLFFNQYPAQGEENMDKEIPFYILVSVPVNNPEKYTITPYSHELAEYTWFSTAVVAGDRLYDNVNADLWNKNLWAIDLKTNELFCLEDETNRLKDNLEQYQKEIEGAETGITVGSVAYAEGDIVIYCGTYFYDDKETVFAVYDGYEKGEYQGSMILDKKDGSVKYVVR